MLFSSSSFLTVVYTFYVISSFFTDWQSEQIIEEISLTAGFLGHLIYMFAIVLSLDDVHTNLHELSDVLDAVEANLNTKQEKFNVKNLRRKILLTEPMTGLGFFNIDKKSFVGMLSFAATYIVILVQFRAA